MKEQNIRKGIWLMVAATFIFAMQDGISRHLAGAYNVYMVVMVRYWFFAAFVTALAARQPGGIRAAATTRQPWVQAFRAVLLVTEVLVMIQGFVILGLVESHAVFASYPLLIAALSGPVLGEKVGWRRWTAIGIGFVGMMIILQPGVTVFAPAALIPLVAALMFALYGLLTRYVARRDSATVSFFWTGVVGAVTSTLIGVWFWQPMSAPGLGLDGVAVPDRLDGALAADPRPMNEAEASAIQPFAYLQLVFVTVMGIGVFGEVLRPNVALGALVVVGAGLFTLWRARVKGA